ncbi:MAG: glycosyltransferase family 2 protein [bacterium]|nr:glycosyltransferase family 2 protein [bacterium]
MARPFLSVIIPAYNEAIRLPLTLVDVDRHLAEQEYSYEIIVVISHSSDHTVEMVKRFASFLPNLKYIALSENRGKGFAVKTGMLAAKGTYRLYMDADNSTAVVEFNKMLPYLLGDKADKEKAKYDIVIGSRFLSGSRISPPMPLMRRILGFKARMWIKVFGVRGFSDTQCGFKAFTSEAAESLFGGLLTDGWLFDVEILAMAKKANLKIKEIPVFWAHNPGSKVNLTRYFNSFRELMRIWVRLR